MVDGYTADTGHSFRFSLNLRFVTSADRGHDANFTVPFDSSLQNLIALHHLTVQKDVHMGAHFALLSQYTIAQSDMPAPKFLQGVANSRRSAFDCDFRSPAGEFSQVTRNLKGDHARFIPTS